MNPPPKFIRIFLVESNPQDEQIITDMLRECGDGQFIVCGTFHRLEDALLGLKNSGGVDLLLLDLTLPDAQGIEAFTRLSHAAPDQPVIVLSGYDDEDIAVQAVAQGAQDFLVKYELTGKLLIRSIQYAMERKREESALKSLREELEKRVEERTQALTNVNQRLTEALEQLSAAQNVATEQERLHSMQRMAGGIAHDFNNALSPILAHSEWLLRKPDALSDEVVLKNALIHIHESAEHCAAVVLRLREFCRTRDEFCIFEEIDVREVVLAAITFTQPSWKDQAQMRGCNISVESHFSDVPKIQGAKEELVEMFSNLILNGVDAIPQSGVISLSVTCADGKVLVCTADNGVGMSEEVGEHCMEPFFTTKRDKGIGLGLGVVHGIAQRHHAVIDIESWEGEGTKVTIGFPVFEFEVESDENPATASEPQAPMTGLRILAVEDEPNIREILGIYLAEDGHQVVLAAEGAEALAKFKKDQFDLLLTDYSMPNMNGDRLAAAVRDRDPKIRIALLTGFGSQLPQGAPLRLEVDAIISKPFTFESLRQGITEAMGGWGGAAVKK